MNGWEFTNSKPIFRQIYEKLKTDIASGVYPPDSRFPSVRDLATDIGVNPNTVQKAMVMLEYDGILETRRGDGRYVCIDTAGRDRLSLEISEGICLKFIREMREIGLDNEEILNSLQKILNSETEGNAKGAN